MSTKINYQSEKIIKDIVIIGGGPVGMFAAYYAGLRDLDIAVLETLPVLGGQIALMYPEKEIIDIGGMPEVTGKILISQLEQQLQTFQPEIFLEEKVIHIEKRDDLFEIQTTGQMHHAKTVLLTTGQGSFKPRPLKLKGAEQYENQNLHYIVAHAEDFRDKNVVICGGGDSAVEWALMLEKVAKQVTIVHRRDQFRAHESFVKDLKASSVQILTPYVPEKLIGDGKNLQSVVLKERQGDDEIELPLDDFIVAYGFASNNEALSEWGLEIAHGSLLVDQQMRSNIPGIFGAGDGVTYDGKVKLIAVGFGEAPIAINSAVKYLRSLPK